MSKVEEGVTAQVTKGKRPEYPPFTFVLWNWFSILRVCFTCTVLHHFVMVQHIAPFLYGLMRGPLVTNFLKTNAAMVWVNSKIAPRLQSRGQDMSDMMCFVIGTTVVHVTMYVCVNGAFALCDRYGGAFVKQYRLQYPKALSPYSTPIIKDTLIEQFKTTVISGPFTLALTFLWLGKWRTGTFDDFVKWDAPFWHQWLYFVGALMTNEFLFYCVHRAVHHPALYKHIHKQHHLYKESIAISSEYASSVEQLFANFIPSIIFCLVVSDKMPLAAYFSFLIMRLFETEEAHSNYALEGTLPYHLGLFHGSARWHCWHHSKNLGCMSSPWCDWCFGTMDFYITDKNKPTCPIDDQFPGGRFVEGAPMPETSARG